MQTFKLENFEPFFLEHMKNLCDDVKDVSHDLSHVTRVVTVAKKLCNLENGKMEVVVPAAYLHDCLYISKNDPRRSSY